MQSMAFDHISQIIGAAYTYKPSLAMRKHLTKGINKHHSSQNEDFTFFYKGDNRTMVTDGGELKLRKHPLTGDNVPHWPESELAMFLGEKHRILGFSLANDFTAYEIEVSGRDDEFDGTYYGKVWPGSVSVGPRFLAVDEVGTLDDLDIGLKIVRGGNVIYDHTYNTSRRRREFSEIPDLAIEYRARFGDRPPPSKRLHLDDDGFLIPGTVIMLGTGLIVSKRAYSQAGDIVTVYAPKLGSITNPIVN